MHLPPANEYFFTSRVSFFFAATIINQPAPTTAGRLGGSILNFDEANCRTQQQRELCRNQPIYNDLALQPLNVQQLRVSRVVLYLGARLFSS
jgi:hypothetical protein